MPHLARDTYCGDGVRATAEARPTRGNGNACEYKGDGRNGHRDGREQTGWREYERVAPPRVNAAMLLATCVRCGAAHNISTGKEWRKATPLLWVLRPGVVCTYVFGVGEPPWVCVCVCSRCTVSAAGTDAVWRCGARVSFQSATSRMVCGVLSGRRLERAPLRCHASSRARTTYIMCDVDFRRISV